MSEVGNRDAPFCRWPGLAALTLLVIQPLIFFRDVLVSKTRHIPFDIAGFHQPLASFIARCVRERVWPFWDPFSYCGTSMWADIQAQLFYPLTWVALLLGNLSQGRKLLYWMEVLVPLHMALGGVFAYLFVRRLRCTAPVALFAATTYQLGAFFASQAQHLGAVCAAAWFPLILLCVVKLAERIEMRWIGITAIAVALTVLSGFPAATDVILISVVLFACSLLLLRLSSWRALLALFAGIATGILMTAVQLIPTVQAYGLSIASLRADWHEPGGLSLQSLMSFFWPDFYHVFSPFDPKLYKLPVDFTLAYTYCGHLALVFVLFAPLLLFLRRREKGTKELRISLGLALLSTLWMMGQATPIYMAIYTRIPRIIQGSLYAEYAIMPFTLWIGVTAALALRELRLKRLTVLSWLVALAASANLIVVSSNRPMNTANGSYKQQNSDYTLDGHEGPVKRVQEFVRSTNPPLRLDFFDPVYGPFNSGAEMYQLPSATGDNPLMNLRYYYFRLDFSGDVYWDRKQSISSLNSPWIAAINDGFLMDPRDAHVAALSAAAYEKVDFFGLWRNRRPLPRFYLVDRVRRAASMEEARKLLSAVTDPSREAIVENLSTAWIGSGREDSFVRTVSYTNNRVVLDVHTTGNSFLVTSETYYPGWKATLNGNSVELLPTNLAFRGLPVPSGDSRIVMTFRPNNLMSSIVLSTFGGIICVALIAMRSTRSRFGMAHGSDSSITRV